MLSSFFFIQEWEARLTMELARCVKCPSVGYQLIGTKKMQQVLANPGVLERYQVLEYSALSLVLKELKLNAMPPCEWNKFYPLRI